jgi:hypothetical protein
LFGNEGDDLSRWTVLALVVAGIALILLLPVCLEEQFS